MKITSTTPVLVRLAMLRRVALAPLKRFHSGKASIKTRTLLGLITIAIAASAMLLSMAVRAQSPNPSDPTALQTAPGHYVTPTALRGAVQQFLNPKLPAYPDFIAGEAVRSQLSPDGKTLAILCAGHNSVVKPDGSNDVPNST